MSTAVAVGWVFALWMPGLPTTVLSRTRLSLAPAAMTIPLVLPVTVFCSTTLPVGVPTKPIPKLFC